MTKAGIIKTVSLKGKEKFLRLGVERYTALFDIAKKNDRDMTKQLDFFMDKFYPNVTGKNRHLRLKNIAEVESLNMCEVVDKFISSQKA